MLKKHDGGDLLAWEIEHKNPLQRTRSIDFSSDKANIPTDRMIILELRQFVYFQTIWN